MKKPSERQSGKCVLRAIRPQNGSELVEFALLLPVILLLLLATIELAVMIHDKQVLTNASREGARAGIIAQEVRPTDAAITSVVNSYCTNYLITLRGSYTPSTTVTRAGTNPGGSAHHHSHL